MKQTVYSSGNRKIQSEKRITFLSWPVKYWIKACSIPYLALLFYIFFLARRRPRASLEPHHRMLNIRPFRKAYYYIQTSPHNRYETFQFFSDFLGNILLFIPMAFILSVTFNIDNKRKILIAVLLISVFVETLQFLLGIGVADIDDVILNMLGGVIGILFLKLFPELKN